MRFAWTLAAAAVALGCSSGQEEAQPVPVADASIDSGVTPDVAVDSGPTCPAGQKLCGDRCVDVSVDRANCGACGTTCESGAVCSEGACAATCATGFTKCEGGAGMADGGAADGGTPGAYCARTATDVANCGACGNACAAGERCDTGECVLSCVAGQIACGGKCIDPTNTREFCGASADCTGTNAGKACVSGEVCTAGACAVSCVTGQVKCGDTCIDPATAARSAAPPATAAEPMRARPARRERSVAVARAR